MDDFIIRLQLDIEANDLVSGMGSSDQAPNIIMDTPVPDINVAPMDTNGVEFQTLQPIAAYGTKGIFQTTNEWITPWDSMQSPAAPSAVKI